MVALHTLSATLTFTKAPITFQGFSLVSAKTSVELPGVSDTVYTVKEQDVTFAIEVVISDATYLHVPFSPFQKLTPTQAAPIPDIARLFNPGTGLPAMIPDGKSPHYQSTEKVDGKDAYKITTSYSPEQVAGLLSQLKSTGDVAATIWVGTSDHYIYRANLDGPFGDGGKEANVQVDISNFNGAVAITSPSP
jgi:lipoprotein LprG